MRRRYPENVLEIEGAEFGSEEERHDQEHVDPAFQARRRSPVVRDPVVRAELADDSLELAFKRRYVPESAPVVRLHGEVLACLHAQIDTKSVAHNHVQNPLLRILYKKLYIEY